MMKKIMFFRPMYYIGGTEIAILNLIKNLKNYEIYIGFTDDTSDTELLENYGKYAKVVKIDGEFNEKMDSLILCSPYKTVLDVHNKIKRDKTILWFHHFGDRESSIFTADIFYEIVDEIIVVSKTCKKIMLKQDYGAKIKNKIKVIYNIINSEDIKKQGEEKEEIDLSHSLNLVSVSRVCYEKGFERQVKLAKALKKHNIDFKWYIIGGNYYKDIENEIKDKFNEIKENFVFLGFLKNPFKIIRQCDYLVLLSDNETWGLVITEAKILGVPCIVTDFDVAYEQILDNETGIILSRENIDSYETKINLIMDNKEKYKNNLKNFIWSNDKLLKKWYKIL